MEVVVYYDRLVVVYDSMRGSFSWLHLTISTYLFILRIV